MATLELWLDTYRDIYSDFDSRHYAKRRVSEDFIHELKLSFLHKTGSIEDITLQLPAAQRDPAIEPVIAESLATYFKKQELVQRDEFRKKRRSGWLLMLSGILVMTVGALISLRANDLILSQILRILLEPAGWFMLWSGMDTFVYGMIKLKRDRIFFTEIAAVKWKFASIENIPTQG